MTLLRNALPGSDRENVRQTQGLATHLNPLRQIPNRLPLCNCSRSSRYLLVMSPDPKPLVTGMRTASRRNSSVYLVAILNLLHSKHCSKETGTKPWQDQSEKEPEGFSEFGYFGWHGIIRVPEEVKSEVFFEDFPKFFELQIKTIFNMLGPKSSTT